MRVPLGWLRDYIDVDLEPEALAERLTLLGMEVKGIERWGRDWRDVVVGELLTVEPHPRADRLSLTTVDVGRGEPLHIVCGATNIAAGQRVPVALPGAILPGERRIERTEKMGVPSEGMLCSGDELRLTTDAEGILILPPETPLGEVLADLYGDVVLDVDVKPNRGDALCLVGLAREISAATGAPLRWPEVDVAESGAPVGERLRVEVREPALCSRFVGRWVSGVTIGPSPERVQMRLLAAGMRPVSNVVDASNYVMLELGKPTHTFDAAAVARDAGGRATIVVRRGLPGERLETLDHVERTLDPETLVIADPTGAIGIAGVMGGATTEVGEATADVIIESAVFDPVSIRRTGQRYALRSEASLRFEKGQEPRLARIGADRVAQLIVRWAGGSVAPGRVDTDAVEPGPTRLPFRPGRVDRLLGVDLAVDEQRQLLERVGITTEEGMPAEPIPVALDPAPLLVEATPGESWVALVPTWRRDLAVEADIAEEVARVRGYELVPGTVPDTPMPAYRPSPLALRDLVRTTLAGAGLTEVVTHALVGPGDETVLPWPDDASEPGVPADEPAGGEPVVVTNPISIQHSVLRRHLALSLLRVLADNERHGRDDVAIFEVGKGYARDGAGTREWWRLGFLLAGHAEPPAWDRVARPWDLDDPKGLIELLCGRLGLPDPTYVPDRRGLPFHPGRALLAVADGGMAGLLAGRVAQLHPDSLAALELRAERVYVAELAIRGLASGQVPVPRVEPIPRVPAVERDLAVIVPEARPAADVAAVIRESAGELLRGLRLFDVYRGAPLEADEKSLAYRLVLQAAVTLKDDEVEAVMDAVRAALGERLGARPRT
ncbi:MAG TPA: phenylalanine--tRNA ligase subunit beta [Candidatus Limnocylindrales bacterium]